MPVSWGMVWPIMAGDGLKHGLPYRIRYGLLAGKRSLGNGLPWDELQVSRSKTIRSMRIPMVYLVLNGRDGYDVLLMDTKKEGWAYHVLYILSRYFPNMAEIVKPGNMRYVVRALGMPLWGWANTIDAAKRLQHAGMIRGLKGLLIIDVSGDRPFVVGEDNDIDTEDMDRGGE